MPRVRVRVQQLGDRHFQINLSDRIALVTQSLLRAGKGGRRTRVKAGYFGFASQGEAIEFTNQIRSRFPKARVEVREAKRLTTQWEVKVAHDCVEELAWQILFQGLSDSQRVAAHVIDFQRRQQLQQQAERKAAAISSASQPFSDTKRVMRDTKRTMIACGDRLVGID